MKLLFNCFVILIMSKMVFADGLGQATYLEACQNCHSASLASAIKAPAAFDKKAWDKRFKHASIEAKKKPKQFKTPLEYLVYRVKIGKGLMYHGGLCHESDAPKKYCSNEALAQAILYMSQ